MYVRSIMEIKSLSSRFNFVYKHLIFGRMSINESIGGIKMHDLQFLNENIFRGDSNIRPAKVEKLLNDYQNLSTEEKKEFINLFFNEKVYDTSVVDKNGTLVVIITSRELA
jgi:hypothetical protein